MNLPLHRLNASFKRLRPASRTSTIPRRFATVSDGKETKKQKQRAATRLRASRAEKDEGMPTEMREYYRTILVAKPEKRPKDFTKQDDQERRVLELDLDLFARRQTNDSNSKLSELGFLRDAAVAALPTNFLREKALRPITPYRFPLHHMMTRYLTPPLTTSEFSIVNPPKREVADILKAEDEAWRNKEHSMKNRKF